MKKTKIIVPALGMLLLSTAASVTGTVAWFSMNTTVTASNMKVQAKAEKGILINEEATATDTHWDELATTNQENPSVLYPASTEDGVTWYHAASKKSSDAGAGTGASTNTMLVKGYETLSDLTAITLMSNTTAAGGTSVAYSTMGEKSDSEAGYYVVYTYYLKSSAQEIELGTDNFVQISRVNAEVTGSDSTKLNKALRVGIILNEKFYIYNPLEGTSSYYVGGAASSITAIAKTEKTVTDLEALPASDQAGVAVNIYLWYEGEDANCTSDNAKAEVLDNITVEVDFELIEA